MDLVALEHELDRLEELHGQGWVVEHDYIRRKEELIANIELAKLDASSSDESEEEQLSSTNGKNELDVSNLEKPQKEEFIDSKPENINNNINPQFSSTNEQKLVAAKPNPKSIPPSVTNKADSDEEDEELDPYDMDTKYDPKEEERKKREKKSGVKEYTTYKEYLEHNPEQYHLREDKDEEPQASAPSLSTRGSGRGGRVLVRGARGRPPVIQQVELPTSAPEQKSVVVKKSNPTPRVAQRKLKPSMFMLLDEEFEKEVKLDPDAEQQKIDDFNANQAVATRTTDLFFDAPVESSEPEEKQKNPNPNDVKPVVYISDRESDDSAFYDTIKGPDVPTEDIRAVWEKLQLEYASKLILKNKEEWVTSRKSPLCNIKYIGGFDISFPKGNKIDACVCLAVLRYSDQRVVFAAYKMIKLKLPYIPGLLNFREVPHYITLLNEVKNHPDYRQFVPDIIMVDGNGILHTRGCGAACQLGYLADIPCLGVAKKLLVVDGVSVKQIEQRMAKEGGKLTKILGASGKLHGMAFKATPRDDMLFVSCGHLIDMDTTAAIVEQSTLIGSPEPVKQADLLSRLYLKENFSDDKKQ